MVLSKTFCHSIHFKLFPFNYVSKYFKLYKIHSWQRGPNHPVLWRHSLYCLPSPPSSNTMWFFASTLIWYHTQTHTHTHTHTPKDTTHWGASALTHTSINIYLHPLLCAHNSYLYYIEWIIHWYQKFTFHNVFSFQKLLTCKNHVSFD